MIEFPPHKCGLFLTHNEHRNYYETVEEFLGSNKLDDEFETPEARQQCIDTDELWELQWYPDTAIGFYRCFAPTLESLMAFVNRGGHKK